MRHVRVVVGDENVWRMRGQLLGSLSRRRLTAGDHGPVGDSRETSTEIGHWDDLEHASVESEHNTCQINIHRL